MKTLIAFATLALVGCKTQLAPQAEAVRLTTNADVVKGCKFIKEVRGSDHMNGGILSGRAEESANNQMKNDTATLGGNVVLVTSSSTGHDGSTQRGEAYLCEGPAK